MAETYRVGLLGHGTVGAAFEQLLSERAGEIAHVTGARPEISGVLTRSRGDFEQILGVAKDIDHVYGPIDVRQRRVDLEPSNFLQTGVTYNWKFRMKTLAGSQNASYQCKLWPVGTAEPSAWDVEAEIPARSGSVLLVADYADVTFGNVSVRPLAP